MAKTMGERKQFTTRNMALYGRGRYIQRQITNESEETLVYLN